MPPRKPKTVVNVTFQGDEWDYDEVVSLGGHRFRLVRVGTSGDAEAAEDLVWRWSLDADAIAVSGIREARAAGHVTGRIEDLQRIKDATKRVPVRDDSLLTDILPGVGDPPRRGRDAGLLRQRPRRRGRRDHSRAHHRRAARVHRQHRLRRARPRPRAARQTQDEPGDGDCGRDRRVRLAADPRLRQGPGGRSVRLVQRQGRPRRRRGRRRHHRLVLRADALRPPRPRRQGRDHQHGLRGPTRHARRARRRPRRGRHPAPLRLRRRAGDVRGDGRRHPATRRELTTDDLARFIQAPSSSRGCCGRAAAGARAASRSSSTRCRPSTSRTSSRSDTSRASPA
jgi:hypothetical protein